MTMIQRFLHPDHNWRVIWMLAGLVLAFAWVASRDGSGRDGQVCNVEQIQTGDVIVANCAVEGAPSHADNGQPAPSRQR